MAAADGGASVLLLEAHETFLSGSNTAMSTSMIPAGGSRWQVEAGIDDSPDLLYQDIMAKTKGKADRVVARALSDVSPRLVEWLADDCSVPLELVTDVWFPGSSRLRHHCVPDRSGRTLHRHLLDAVEESYGEDMLWFFDQWVYGTDMPEYRPRLEARQVNGGWRLQGSIAQSKTSHDFRMPLPVRIHLRDGTTQVVIIPVAGDGVQVDEPLRGPVDRIEVNPLESVLATIR